MTREIYAYVKDECDTKTTQSNIVKAFNIYKEMHGKDPDCNLTFANMLTEMERILSVYRMPKIYFGFFLFFDLIQQPGFGTDFDFFVIYANVNIHFAIVFVFHGYAHNIFVGIYPQSMHYLLMVEVK
jgi:hypothetical protein